MQELEHWPIGRFIEYARNPRKNDHAVDKVAAAIREFGFRVPIVAKSDGLIVDGHLRLKAAQRLGMTEVPVILADDLTDAQIKAFRLSVNRMAELAEWDNELLVLELEEIGEMGSDLDLAGFSEDEIAALTPGGEREADDGGKEYVEHFAVLVNCDDAGQQEKIYNALTGQGYDCKVLVN